MMTNTEMQRRWRLTREAMAGDRLDWVVCTLGHPFGYAKWLAERVGLGGTLVALPLEGDLVLGTHGDSVHHVPHDSPGIRHIASPAQPNLAASTQAPGLIEIIAKTRPRRIGFLAMGYLAAATYKAFLDAFPNVEFVDATDLVAPIKAVKSDEEMVCMRSAADLHDRAIEVARRTLRAGIRARDVMDEVRDFVCRQGSPTQSLMAGSAPPGQPCRYGGPPDRIIEPGDQFAMLIECSEVNGYYSEAMPTICLGEVPKPLARVHADALEIQEILAGLARPGAEMESLMRVNDDYMRRKGYPPEGRLLGHAQGLDLVERPALSPLGDKLRLQANTVFSIHPTTHAADAWGFACNLSFFVGEKETVRMLKTPNDLIVV